MKQISKQFKTVAIGTLFAAAAMLSTSANAIYGGDGDNIVQYMSTWDGVQNLCGLPQVTCVNIRASGSGWWVTWNA